MKDRTPKHIFISYSKTDERFLQELRRKLQKQGYYNVVSSAREGIVGNRADEGSVTILEETFHEYLQKIAEEGCFKTSPSWDEFREQNGNEQAALLPPSFATRLLRILPLSEAQREDMLGDLEEEYHERYCKLGERKAQTWYYSQVVRSLQPLLIGRLKTWLSSAIRRIIS